MDIALTLDRLGNVTVSDGLHRVVLDAPIVQALVELVATTTPGLVATSAARPLLVVPLAAEATLGEVRNGR